MILIKIQGYRFLLKILFETVFVRRQVRQFQRKHFALWNTLCVVRVRARARV